MFEENIVDKGKENYWKILLIIGFYYLLPSLQFVMFQTKEPDIECYYNFECKHDFMGIPAFNNVASNIFYFVYGLLFLIIVKLYGKNKYSDGVSSMGIDQDNSLYYSVGLSLMLEGICSSLFHMCPSQLNFQFDTSFMFIGTTLMFLTLYQKRHNTRIPSPLRVYFILAILIFINLLPLSGASNGNELWFWIIIDIILSYIMLFGSVYVYYGKEYDLDMDSLIVLYRKIKNIKYREIPRFLLLLILNSFTLSMIIYGSISKPDFTMWLLALFIINMAIYFIFYLVQKVIHKEYINYKIWFSLLIDQIILITALIFFETPVSDKYLSPEDSRKLNHKCILFDYWDYHDIWHIFSATGLFMFMIIVFLIDKNLDNILTIDIPIF